MRSVPCVRSWHNLDYLPFDDGFVCSLAFRHKNGKYIFELVEFLFSEGEHFWLVGACGV